MNLPIQPPQPIAWHLLLESLADGKVAAQVAELPDCQLVAESREAAIEQLNAKLEQRLSEIEIVPSFVQQAHFMAPQQHPIEKFFGIFKDDPDFDSIVAQMRAERELDDDNPAYT